jgi:uncharacterized membrane protein
MLILEIAAGIVLGVVVLVVGYGALRNPEDALWCLQALGLMACLFGVPIAAGVASYYHLPYATPLWSIWLLGMVALSVNSLYKRQDADSMDGLIFIGTIAALYFFGSAANYNGVSVILFIMLPAAVFVRWWMWGRTAKKDKKEG